MADKLPCIQGNSLASCYVLLSLFACISWRSNMSLIFLASKTWETNVDRIFHLFPHPQTGPQNRVDNFLKEHQTQRGSKQDTSFRRGVQEPFQLSQLGGYWVLIGRSGERSPKDPKERGKWAMFESNPPSYSHHQDYYKFSRGSL